MFVEHFFELNEETKNELRSLTPEFGYNGFGEFIFYRTYSRRICDTCRKPLKYDGQKDYCKQCGYDFVLGQENWADVVIRCIEGTFSIRKDWYIKNHIEWKEYDWQHYAYHMALSMFRMCWSPPGRGLWCAGTDFVYERGSMALQNCAFKHVTNDIGKDVAWVMDSLMCVPADSWTLTDKGPRQIYELVNATQVTLIVNGIPYKTEGFFPSGEKEVFEIETIEGHKFQATGNHQVLIDCLGIRMWQEVKDLSEDTKLYLNRHKDLEWDGEGTYEEGYLIGQIVGDGHLTKTHHSKTGYQAEIDLWRDDFDLVDFISNCLEDLNVNYDENKGIFRIRSVDLNTLCATFNLDNNKIINADIEKASSDFLCGFISAFFDTDGSACKEDAAAMMTQSNLPRLEAVQRILLRLGINSTLRLERLGGPHIIQNKKCKTKNKYRLRIGKENILQFKERINFQSFRKRRILENRIKEQSKGFIREKFLATVKSIKSVGVKRVYDVKVPGINAFDSNGFYVHNCGTGVGFRNINEGDFQVYSPTEEYDFIIEDNRESWCESVKAKIDSRVYPNQKKPRFIYDKIRGPNLPIRGFGGISSGPQPLKDFHAEIDFFFEMYLSNDWYTLTHLKADLVNAAGCMTVSGNVRRSAELLAGEYDEIAELKNYEKYPYREAYGFMSNNSILLETDEDFDHLADIAESIKKTAEPGFLNIKNFPYARLGKKMRGLKKDKGTGTNPLILAA